MRVPASRRHGATVAREIPDLKVGGSNPSGVTLVFFPFSSPALSTKTKLSHTDNRSTPTFLGPRADAMAQR